MTKLRQDVEESIRRQLDKIWLETEERLQKELNAIWAEVEIETAKVRRLEERLAQSEKKIANLESVTDHLQSAVRALQVLYFLPEQYVPHHMMSPGRFRYSIRWRRGWTVKCPETRRTQA